MKSLPVLILFSFFLLLFPWAPPAEALDIDINNPPLTCTPGNSDEERVSRPNQCEPCNLTDNLSSSCATSPTVKSTVTYSRGAGDDEAPHCIEESWGGTVTMDLSEVSIPFVGKSGQEDETKYLADYLEGTAEYYTTYFNAEGFLASFNPFTKAGPYWLSGVNYAGALRKLTPMAYQNQLKEDMVGRAQDSLNPEDPSKKNSLEEGKIHDYSLNYIGRLCWDAPFWADILAAFAGRIGVPGAEIVAKIHHYCFFSKKGGWFSLSALVDDELINFIKTAFSLMNLSPVNLVTYWEEEGVRGKLSDLAGHFPPDPNEEDYEKKWQEWKEKDDGKWFRLWKVVPMVTREDTPGYLEPYLGWRPEDKPDDKNFEDKIEQVPHVARLYEASQILQGMLIPYVSTPPATSQNPLSLANEDAQVLSASTDESCGLAAPAPVPPCQTPILTDTNPNDTLCCQESISVGFTAVDRFSNPDYESCRAEGITCTTIPDCLPSALNNYCQSCHDPCDDTREQEVQRQIGLNVYHPYLDDIWNQTANAESGGIFNLFRPAGYPKFTDIDAADEIIYSYSGDGSFKPTDGTDDKPKSISGQFHFKHLGGVQLGKEWLTKALTPYKQP
jgi:hypothetical protein